MALKLTKPQQDAVNANGNVLVSAAAGSGKTAVLVERVIKRFCDEENPLMANRALIVTFTNAAAAELKLKIENKLKALLKEEPNNYLLRRQNILIKSAKICTIDSFCISVVKEYFNLLNISSDIKTTDISEVYEDYTEILDNLIKAKHNENSEKFNKLLDLLQSGYDDSFLKQVIMTLYNKSCSMPYQEKWLDDIANLYTIPANDFKNSNWVACICDSAIKDAEDAYNLSLKLYDESLSDNSFFEKYSDALLKRVNFAKDILRLLNNRDWQKIYETTASYIPDSIRKNASKNLIISSLISASKDAEKQLIKTLSDAFQYDQETAIKSLNKAGECVNLAIEIAKEYLRAINDYSKNNNVYTFDQVEHLALKLFTEHSEIVFDDFSLNFDAILVDEYQDTNNLQDELFNILSRKNGQLFMVGDVKQSIYGFRNANPDNFLKRKNQYPDYEPNSNNSKVLLSGNFRSRAEICKFVNYIFKGYMTKSDADMEYTNDEELIPLGDYQDNNEDAVESYIIDSADFDNNAIAEANFIADYITNTLKKDAFLKDEKGGLRKPNLNDFCIIMRSPKNKIMDYVSVFEQRGIPVSTPAQKFSESTEIIDALSMLKSINNFNDSLSIAALLKSPIFRFDENELAFIRAKDKNVPLYINLKASASEGNEKSKKAYSFLKKASKLSTILPLDKLLNNLFSELGFMEIYSCLQNGEMRKANLRLLVEKAAGYNHSDNGIDEFIRYIESDRNKALSANIISSNESVKIMSVHNSKGLQFPICIICDLGTKFNLIDSQSKIVCDDTYGIAFDYFDDTYGAAITPISKTAIKKATVLRTYKEELRLLYVALTRACEKLVLVSSNKNVDGYLEKLSEISCFNSSGVLPFNRNSIYRGNSYAEWIFSAILCHKNGRHLVRGSWEIYETPYDTEFSAQIYKPTNESVLEKDSKNIQYNIDFGDKFLYQYPHKALESIPAKTSVTDILGSTKTDELTFKTLPAFLSDSGFTSAEKGTATHKFMQFCDYDSAAIDIDSEIFRLYEWQYISYAESEVIDKDSVKSFFDSYVFGMMKKAKKVHKEYRFLTKIKASKINSDVVDFDDEFSVVQGVADCVIENENDIVLVDYKTDKENDITKLISRYSNQLTLYAEALEKIFNKPVSAKILYSFHLKQCIEL